MITIRQLDPAQIDAFFDYHCEENDAGWCHCVAWHTPTWAGWPDRTATQNRTLRDHLFQLGQFDGYLAYDDGETPVGWTQVGPRDRLTKLLDRYQLDPNPAIWAITCFNIGPHRRRRGVAPALLHHAIDDLRQAGVPTLQAFPPTRHRPRRPRRPLDRPGVPLHHRRIPSSPRQRNPPYPPTRPDDLTLV